MKTDEELYDKMCSSGIKFYVPEDIKEDIKSLGNAYEVCNGLLERLNKRLNKDVWSSKIGKNGEMTVYREHAKVLSFNTYEINLYDFGDDTADEDIALLNFIAIYPSLI